LKISGGLPVFYKIYYLNYARARSLSLSLSLSLSNIIPLNTKYLVLNFAGKYVKKRVLIISIQCFVISENHCKSSKRNLIGNRNGKNDKKPFPKRRMLILRYIFRLLKDCVYFCPVIKSEQNKRSFTFLVTGKLTNTLNQLKPVQ
jgi:hypothetical protein